MTMNRTMGLGASDAPAACGVSPWKTPLALWLEKTGQSEPVGETLPMSVGKALEPIVLRTFEERTGLTVTRRQERIPGPLYDWQWATVDGIVEGACPAVVEAKTAATSDGWGPDETDQIPEHYLVQVAHQLAVTGYSVAYVPVLIATRELRVYEIARDEELIALITEQEAKFWDAVTTRTPPEPRTYADVQALFGKRAIVVQIEADAETASRCQKLADIQATIATLEEDKNFLKAQICNVMGEADTLVFRGRTIATWKAAKGARRLDVDALKTEMPDVYQQFTRQSEPTRRFMLK